MIERLTRNRANRNSATGVGGCVCEHLEEQRLGEVEAATRGEEQAVWREEAQRPEIDVLVTSDGCRQRRSGLREGGWIEDDRVEAISSRPLLAEVIERISFDELDVRDVVARAVLSRPRERRSGDVESDDGVGASREMQRKRSVVAEAIEGATARAFADEHAVFALIEKRAGFLAESRCCEKANAVFVDFDLVGHVTAQHFDADRQLFLGAQRDVVAREDACMRDEVT